MDKQLIDWLNARDKSYETGVQLLKKYRPDINVPPIQGPIRKADIDSIFEALKTYYYQHKQLRNQSETTSSESETPATNNNELSTACKIEADKSYKLMQHARSQLFALCPIVKDENENNQMLVDQRGRLAMLLLDLQSQTDKNYALYRHVLEHNKLPDTTPSEIKKPEFPEEKIDRFKMLSNLRKNLNKLKKKEPTPERIAKIQAHQEKITILENEFGKSK